MEVVRITLYAGKRIIGGIFLSHCPVEECPYSANPFCHCVFSKAAVFAEIDVQILYFASIGVVEV